MKITIFTSNQIRHLSFIRELAKVSNECFAIIESNTLFPGIKEDFFKKSEHMQNYFKKVIAAENKIFQKDFLLGSNIKTISARMGDLNNFNKKDLDFALNSDIYIVFGASYIKGWLVDFLLRKKAINIHMGISPYYRGSSCNFWATYHENYHLVGATIHLLSKGLDSGKILYHVIPNTENCNNCFEFSMNSVKQAHNSIIENIKIGRLLEFNPIMQNKALEISYTRNYQFNDEVVIDFLKNQPSMEYIKYKIQENYDEKLYLNRYQ